MGSFEEPKSDISTPPHVGWSFGLWLTDFTVYYIEWHNCPQTDQHIKANMIAGASFHQKPQKTVPSFVFFVPDKQETAKGHFRLFTPLLKFCVVCCAPFILFLYEEVQFFLILIWVHQIIIISFFLELEFFPDRL